MSRSGALAAGAQQALNVLGTPLQLCCTSPLTGFFRDGYCVTGPADTGRHTVCAVVTADFLSFTASRGNDLATPGPGFPGLRPGDKWCLCAARWLEAFKNGKAPGVVLNATNQKALQVVPLDALLQHSVPEPAGASVEGGSGAAASEQ